MRVVRVVLAEEVRATATHGRAPPSPLLPLLPLVLQLLPPTAHPSALRASGPAAAPRAKRVRHTAAAAGMAAAASTGQAQQPKLNAS